VLSGGTRNGLLRQGPGTQQSRYAKCRGYGAAASRFIRLRISYQPRGTSDNTVEAASWNEPGRQTGRVSDPWRQQGKKSLSIARVHHPRAQHPSGNCRLRRRHRERGAMRRIVRTPMLPKCTRASFLLVTLGARLASARSQRSPNVAAHLEILGFTLGKRSPVPVDARSGYFRNGMKTDRTRKSDQRKGYETLKL